MTPLIRRVFAPAIVVIAVIGCDLEDPDAHTLLQCVERTGWAVKGAGAVASNECAVPAPWTLLALPAGRTSEQQLADLGVPEGLVDLASRVNEQPQLCAMREFAVDARSTLGSEVTARFVCYDAKMGIAEPMVVAGRRVQVVVSRLESGQLQLTSLRPF